MKRLSSLFLGVCLLLAWAAQASELRVLLNEKKVDAGSSWSDEGFQIQLAKLLAERSRRELKFVTLSRKRLAKALEDGEGDILCGYLPAWLAGNFDWSTGFIDVADVLVSERRTLPPRSIADLAGLRIGTVLGYSYPEVESILGKNFIRDDGPGAASNLRKLVAKRFDYAIVSEAVLLHHLKSNDPPLSINPPLLIKQFKTQCAVSKKGNIGVAEINKLIAEIQADGSLGKLMGSVNRPHQNF
ncbi:ABC transporter substrate-binding protein [Undibacterium sp.]|uniref:substrate-binding periplasmic protein n=1 Tax=Undibacterium sp. TaxID=1914977 RepID=UPI0025DA030E|nr:transporter substrate-binding domain-containing protein [Undibacterium sp.]